VFDCYKCQGIPTDFLEKLTLDLQITNNFAPLPPLPIEAPLKELSVDYSDWTSIDPSYVRHCVKIVLEENKRLESIASDEVQEEPNLDSSCVLPLHCFDFSTFLSCLLPTGNTRARDAESNLEELTIGDGELTDLPENIFSSLKTLRISDLEQFIQLPPSMKSLPS
jgi:Leucine-rich repeat (LRR) protein